MRGWRAVSRLLQPPTSQIVVVIVIIIIIINIDSNLILTSIVSTNLPTLNEATVE